MTKSEQQFRHLVREEIRRLLITERFGSKILSKLHSTTVPKDYASNKQTNKAAFHAMSKTYNIKWDKITDKDIKKSNKLTKKGLEIIVATKDGEIRPTDRWASTIRIKKGQMMGVSMNGKRVWMGGGWYKPKAATGQGSRAGNIGLDARGFNKLDQLLKIDVNPIVLQVDYEAGGDASSDRASREEARRGALALKKANVIKDENKKRYRDLMKQSAGSKGIAPLKKMLDEVTKMYHDALTESVNKLKDGFVNTDWDTDWKIIANSHEDMFRNLKEYIEGEEEMKRSENEYSIRYAKEQRDSAAKGMYQTYKSMKERLKILKQKKSGYKKIEGRGW